MRNNFSKRLSGVTRHTLSKLFDFPVDFVTFPLIWGSVYFFICGHQWVAVAQYVMIFLDLLHYSQ